MLVRELVDYLIAMWPRDFNSQKLIDAWGKQYRGVLGRYEGEKLQRAWNETMRTWTKPGFPKPADIAQAVGVGETEAAVRAAAKGVDRKALGEYVRTRVPELVRLAVAEFQHEPWKGCAAEIAEKLAFAYAQGEWLRDNAFISEGRFAQLRYQLDPDDVEKAIGRYETRERLPLPGERVKTLGTALPDSPPASAVETPPPTPDSLSETPDYAKAS